VRFRVLGAFGVTTADAEVAVGGARVRTLLAALWLRPGQLVTTESLLYDVWGEQLPSNPRSALQAAISRLRSALGIDLQHESGGYRIDLSEHELDLVRYGWTRSFKAVLTAGRGGVAVGLCAGRVVVSVSRTVVRRLRWLFSFAPGRMGCR
jgi:hypothetical protein